MGIEISLLSSRTDLNKQYVKCYFVNDSSISKDVNKYKILFNKGNCFLALDIFKQTTMLELMIHLEKAQKCSLKQSGNLKDQIVHSDLHIEKRNSLFISNQRNMISKNEIFALDVTFQFLIQSIIENIFSLLKKTF